MIALLGWERRRKYEEMFEGLEALSALRAAPKFDVDAARSIAKSLSYDIETLQPETAQYFEGIFRRAGKAWTLGYAIAVRAGTEP